VMATPDALDAADSVPQAAPLHPVPDSAQPTPLFAESFATVAVNCCVVPTCTLAVADESAMEIVAGAVPPPWLDTVALQPDRNVSAIKQATKTDPSVKCARGRFTVQILPSPNSDFW
jgi:hypothetical protein